MKLQDKLIKLFIGLVLFATMVCLTVAGIPNTGRILDLCYGALIGLGVMHLGSVAPLGSDVTPPKDGGFSSVSFLLLLIGATLVTACAMTPTANTAYVDACSTYNTAFGTALMLRDAGKLTQSQIDQITKVESQMTPLCTGPLPANQQEATSKIVTAVGSLILLITEK